MIRNPDECAASYEVSRSGAVSPCVAYETQDDKQSVTCVAGKELLCSPPAAPPPSPPPDCAGTFSSRNELQPRRGNALAFCGQIKGGNFFRRIREAKCESSYVVDGDGLLALCAWKASSSECVTSAADPIACAPPAPPTPSPPPADCLCEVNTKPKPPAHYNNGAFGRRLSAVRRLAGTAASAADADAADADARGAAHGTTRSAAATRRLARLDHLEAPHFERRPWRSMLFGSIPRQPTSDDNVIGGTCVVTSLMHDLFPMGEWCNSSPARRSDQRECESHYTFFLGRYFGCSYQSGACTLNLLPHECVGDPSSKTDTDIAAAAAAAAAAEADATA